MRRIFGAKTEKEAKPTLDQTSDKLSGRGDKADEQIKKLDVQLVQYKEQIKRTRPGPVQDSIKRKALQVLKQKKMYEGQRDQLYTQQFNLDQTKFTIDSVSTTVQTVQAMKEASKELKGQFKKNKELNINYIDKMQDEMFDLMDMAGEINEAMGRSYDVPDDVDESDLMAELDALEGELAMEEPSSGTPSYLQEPELGDLPSAPTEVQKEQEALPAMRT